MQASFDGANIVIAIYGLGLPIFRNRLWPIKATAPELTFSVLLGGSIALAIELFALKTGRWN